MGRMFIEGFLAEGVEEDIVLQQHLQYNVYPPIPAIMFDTCKMAIEMANSGQWEAEIELPEGVLYKGKEGTAPANSIIENCRLDAFITQYEDY